MAKQAGAMFDHMTWVERDLFPVFERFAKLVAEKEREACAKIIDDNSEKYKHAMFGEQEFIKLAEEIRNRIPSQRQ